MRKQQILAPISGKDHKGLLADAKRGHVSYRETFLGGCAKLGSPCPLGGISNVAGCMGSGDDKPCPDVLLDREKRPVVVKLRDLTEKRLSAAEPGSHQHDALEEQLVSMERALDVIDRK